MKNYFSESSHLLTKDFIGLLIWMCAFIPGLLIKPEKLQIPFVICFFFFAGTCIVCLAWYVLDSTTPSILAHRFSTGLSHRLVVQARCSMSLAQPHQLDGVSCSV